MTGSGKDGMLDAARLGTLLSDIGEALAREGVVAEIALHGGSAVMLAIGTRKSTRDVDYALISGDEGPLARAAEEAGRRHGMPDGWFNDAVAMFSSDSPDYELLGDFPPGSPGLKVFTATPRYLLAMKLLAMRSPFETNDLKDVWDLLDACGITHAEEAEEFLARFYPDERMPRHKALILKDLFEAKSAGQEYSPMLGWSS